MLFNPYFNILLSITNNLNDFNPQTLSHVDYMDSMRTAEHDYKEAYVVRERCLDLVLQFLMLSTMMPLVSTADLVMMTAQSKSS